VFSHVLVTEKEIKAIKTPQKILPTVKHALPSNFRSLLI